MFLKAKNHRVKNKMIECVLIRILEVSYIFTKIKYVLTVRLWCDWKMKQKHIECKLQVFGDDKYSTDILDT